MMELIVFKAKASTPEELEMVKQALNGLFGEDDMSPEEIQKLKKSEYNKRYYDKKKSESISETSEIQKEEREKKEKESNKEKEIKEKEELKNNILIPPTEKISEKQRFGSGKNVLLTAEQYQKLKEKFHDADERIERMSLYFGSKGVAGKYKDHYLTLLSWDRMDEEKKQKQPAQNQTGFKSTYQRLKEMGEI